MTHIFCRRSVILSLLGLLLFWTTVESTRIVAEDFLIGAPFQKALDQPTGLTWAGDSLRSALQELSRTKKVSILLDRRIDSSQELKFSRSNIALRDLIAAVADSVGAGTAIISNVVYVGPKTSAERLQILIDLRNKELNQLAAVKLAAKTKESNDAKNPWQTRSAKLKVQRTLTWIDFDHPRDLLHQLEVRHQIEIEKLDQVPHDLWAANSLPQVNAIEALSLLLIQFGSTFEFLPDRPALRIIPLQEEEAVVEVTHSLPVNAAEKIIRELQGKFRTAKIEQDGLKVMIRATAEQHLAIAQFLKQPRSGSSVKSTTTSKADKTDLSPLSRKFTLTVKNAPLLEVMKTFEASGIRFDYDVEQLESAKISLDRKVDIDVKGMTAEAILRKLLEPLELEVSADGNTLRLSPKKSERCN